MQETPKLRKSADLQQLKYIDFRHNCIKIDKIVVFYMIIDNIEIII